MHPIPLEDSALYSIYARTDTTVSYTRAAPIPTPYVLSYSSISGSAPQVSGMECSFLRSSFSNKLILEWYYSDTLLQRPEILAGLYSSVTVSTANTTRIIEICSPRNLFFYGKGCITGVMFIFNLLRTQTLSCIYLFLALFHYGFIVTSTHTLPIIKTYLHALNLFS